MSFNELQEQVKELAWRAVELDKANQVDSAIFFYLEASQVLVNFTQSEQFGQLTETQRNVVQSKLKEYISRAETLKKLPLGTTHGNEPSSGGNKIFPSIKSELEVQ
jgi:hypothetical protein